MKKLKFRKHWFYLGFRFLQLSFNQPEKTTDLVIEGYNQISKNYDTAWTTHMRKMSDEMLERLSVPNNSKCLDLSCGTGYVTSRLASLANEKSTGVDLSSGMLEIAEKNYGSKCNFIKSDILEFLKKQPNNSFDIITCAWALCYSHPYQVIHEIKRILKPGGKVGIIDNAFSAIWEIFFAGIYTVAENPKMLKHVFKIHLLANTYSLSIRMRLNGLKVLDKWKGYKTYYAKDGIDVIKRLRTTGAASGYQDFVDKKYYDYILERFPKNVESLFMTKKGIPIIHRYIAAIGLKNLK